MDAEVRELVREAVKVAGGLAGIVEDGQVVVIKPNVVMTRAVGGGIKLLMTIFDDPFRESQQVPELVNGITTDRRVTRAVVELVRELNPSGKVYVMECAGDGLTSENFRRMGYTHENIPGVDDFVAIGEDGEHRNTEAGDLVAVEVENRQYKKLPRFLKDKYYFDKTYYSADVIISLGCVKNHMCAAVSGGIKNVGIGARPACIYAPRGRTGSTLVIGHGWKPLNAFIHDYYSARPADFVLSDGLQGLSYGPAAHGAPGYDQARMNLRIILASKDPVACDAVQACIVGVDPERVPCLRDLADEGFGTIDTSRITVLGNARVDEVKKPFPLARGLIGRLLSRGPRKAVYGDFSAPELQVEAVSFKDGELSASLKVDPKTTKIELQIDGRLAATVVEGFEDLRYRPPGGIPGGTHAVTILAYDRFFNCGHRSVEVVV